MSLSPQELKEHCEQIIQSRRIKNKIVILCEGDIPKNNGRPSPQSYGKMEQMPDANFYNACVPQWWRQNRPQFFNCGDRKDVIDTYSTLINLHNQAPNNSYLTPDKLFAIVDLDLQSQTINNYTFPDTESIFNHLYEKALVKESNAEQHRIWVTGLIHKEAYFIIPELQDLFDNYPNSPTYNSNRLQLPDIYLEMANTIQHDSDLQSNFHRASARISHCCGLDCSEAMKLCKSWQQEFQTTQDETRKNELIIALLMIKKAKNYWYQIQPPNDWTSSPQVFREQLSLAIGRFYSAQNSEVKYHIPFFLKNLYNFV
jgi:hypothetical protein